MMYTAQQVRDRWVGITMPDPMCQHCQYRSYVQGRAPGFESSPDRDGYIMPCHTCAVRKPFAKAAEIPLDRLQAYLDEAPEAFSIEQALNELLP